MFWSLSVSPSRVLGLPWSGSGPPLLGNLNEQHFKRSTWEEGLPCSSSWSPLLGEQWPPINMQRNFRQHTAKLRSTYGETPINIRRNSNQHMAKLQHGETSANIRRDSEHRPFQLRTTSVPTPNKIGSNSGQHPSKLRTTSVQTPDNIRSNSEQEMIRLSNLKPSAACVSVGVRGCHLHNNISVRVSFQSLLCKCFPQPMGTAFFLAKPFLSHYLYLIAFSQGWINTASFWT